MAFDKINCFIYIKNIHHYTTLLLILENEVVFESYSNSERLCKEFVLKNIIILKICYFQNIFTAEVILLQILLNYVKKKLKKKHFLSPIFLKLCLACIVLNENLHSHNTIGSHYLMFNEMIKTFCRASPNDPSVVIQASELRGVLSLEKLRSLT